MDGIKICFLLVVIFAVIGSYKCGRSGGGRSASNEDEVKIDVEVSEAPLRIARHLVTRSRPRATTARRVVHVTPRSRPVTRQTTARRTTRRTTKQTTERRTRPTTRSATRPRPKPTKALPTKRITKPWYPVTQPTTQSTTKRTTKSRYPVTPPSVRDTTKHTTKAWYPVTPATIRDTTKHTTKTWYPVTQPTTRNTTKYITKPRYPVTQPTTRDTTKYITKPRYPVTPPTTQSTTKYATKAWYPNIKHTKSSTKRTTTWPIGGKQEIKIVNKYNYNYPGYYSIPVQQVHHPGYYQTYSTYSYTPSDTGSGILGFYLGYKLAKLSTPTYAHESFYDGYRPRYDHYTIHHYYHNKESVPSSQEILSNTIIGCVGDSVEVCPTNTTSLCTNDGRLMCVVPVAQTISCSDDNRLYCSRSLVSCVNNTAPECAGTKNNNTVVTIPCLSSAKIYGNITFANRTLITNDTGPSINLSSTTTTTTPQYSTLYPMSTTPESTTNASVYWKWKRSVPQQPSVVPQEFCVTIVALPARKPETEGEKAYKDAKDLLNTFFENVWKP